jgi:hypothetical protein
MQIRATYLFILATLAAILTIAISVYQFAASQCLTEEFQTRSLDGLETSLLESARLGASSLNVLSADNLLEPLFFEDIDSVGNIVRSLLERDEVISAAVFTRHGELFHSGSPKLHKFDDKAPPETLELLAHLKQQVEPLVDMTSRIVTPVVADGYVFGALDMLIDTHFVE